jgi:hypothetical protein
MSSHKHIKAFKDSAGSASRLRETMPNREHQTKTV